jgi:prepilin-type N-terminal cleavage/methylation domain-containing protein
VRRSSRAFTLIEVMAAALILGVFVTALSEMLARASRFEGDTRRIAEAAALADRELARIEEGMQRGAAPPLGKTENAEDFFSVATEVRAFDVAGLVLEPEAEGSRPPVPRASVSGDAGWLAAPTAAQSPPILEIDVAVTWEGAPVDTESGEPFTIRRRSFALNPAALETLAENPGDQEGVD